MKGLSFVVVTYNSASDILACLESIARQVPPPVDTIVIDNASSDDTVALVRRGFPEVRLLENERNMGYGAANNRGVSAASAELVAIVNPDVRLEPSWSFEMRKVMEGHASCGAAEGKLLLAKRPEILNSRGSYMNILGFGCVTGYGSRDVPDPQVRLVSYPSGAAFVTRKNTFLEIGGFDTSYFLYHEDVDLGLRLCASGWEVLYVPSAVAFHDLEEAWGLKKISLLERNRWKTLAKNMPVDYFVRAFLLLVVSEIALSVFTAINGMMGARVPAILDFVHDLPQTLRSRKSHSTHILELGALQRITADEFPAFLPWQSTLLPIAKQIQSGYRKAFFCREGPA